MDALEVPPFSQLYTPAEAAQVLSGWYGQGAKRAVAGMVQEARADGRADDADFWMAVLLQLCGRNLDQHFLKRRLH